jgi:hypothetical protein
LPGRCQGRAALRLPPEQQSLGVFSIDLLQHFVGEEDPVDVPEALEVVAGGAVEVFVVGFEEAVVDPVGVAVRGGVGPEEDPVLLFEEELAGGVGLAAEFGDPGVD